MAIYMMREFIIPDYLCFTAEQAGSTVKLEKIWSPTLLVAIETSTDGVTWSDYTFGTDITLTNVGDKIYLRSKSETVTNFSENSSNYFHFTIAGLVGASGDVNYLLCKNSTDTISNNYCFYRLFQNATKLTTPPKLLATTLKQNCYREMFKSCSNLEALPALSAITLQQQCYYSMFQWCSKIKLSSTQTWDYQTAYRIPTTWTWATASSALSDMFYSTWWTFKWSPTINTTYYTSNTVV